MIKLNLFDVGEIIESETFESVSLLKQQKSIKRMVSQLRTWSASVIVVYLKTEKNFLLKNFCGLFVAPRRIKFWIVTLSWGRIFFSSIEDTLKFNEISRNIDTNWISRGDLKLFISLGCQTDFSIIQYPLSISGTLHITWDQAIKVQWCSFRRS